MRPSKSPVTGGIMIGSVIVALMLYGMSQAGLSAEDVPIAVAATALSGVLYGGIGAFLLWVTDKGMARREAQVTERPGARLTAHIARVNTAFAEAASLMDDLRRDLDAQQAARDSLIAQAREHERLLGIDKEKAEEIRQILVGETKASIRAERRHQWLFFALGLAASIPIGVLVNLLVP